MYILNRVYLIVLVFFVGAVIPTGAHAERLSALTGALGTSGAPAEESEEPDRSLDAQALERAIALLEDEQSRKTLLEDLRALQQGLQAEETAEGERPDGLLSALSVRMAWLGDSLTLKPTLNRWGLLLETAGEDLDWLLSEPEGRARLVKQAGTFVEMMAIIALIAVLSWRIVRIPIARVERRERRALAASIACTPFVAAFATALIALPLLGATTGARLAVVVTYVGLGAAGLYMIAALLLSLVEHGRRRRRLVGMLLKRTRPWLIAIGASVAAADALSNTWVAEPLGNALPAVLSTWLYLLTAMLCGMLAFRHHRLATMTLRPRLRRDRLRFSLWLTAGKVAARSWQWAVISVSAISFLGILLLQGEEQMILRAGVISAILVVLTTLIGSLVTASLDHLRVKLKSPPHRSYYLAAYMRIARAVAVLLVSILGLELILLAWGSSLGNFLNSVVGDELGAVLVSVLIIMLLGALAWVTLKTAIERKLAEEGQGLQAQSARSRTLLPLLRSVGLVVILITMVIALLSALGVNTTPLLAGAGVLGLAIGFGSQKLVQDLITGLFILFEDTISLGDYIQVAGHEGIVEGLSVRTVRMRDLSGTLHAVPFGQITSVRNLSKDFAYALMDITVAYSEDVDQIINELEEIGEELRKDPVLGWDILEPLEVFGLQKFTPDGMVVRVRFMTRPLRQWDVMRGYNLRIKRRFDELGIQLPVQQVMVHQAEGATRAQDRPHPVGKSRFSQANGPLFSDDM